MGVHRSPVDSSHKGPLKQTMICSVLLTTTPVCCCGKSVSATRTCGMLHWFRNYRVYLHFCHLSTLEWRSIWHASMWMENTYLPYVLNSITADALATIWAKVSSRDTDLVRLEYAYFFKRKVHKRRFYMPWHISVVSIVKSDKIRTMKYKDAIRDFCNIQRFQYEKLIITVRLICC